ncbi:MAG: hypothetical protein KGQ42_02960 [Alphaproteobacteria bacterium]|nr:hypothetical protein [Alphaproteobacteria bacterium]MDE2043351.1 hypothetical protein [Alphaproteobacteria bacterium]MDE2341092.1 hypothetical protein [Alphaproteobacteria bacterium]
MDNKISAMLHDWQPPQRYGDAAQRLLLAAADNQQINVREAKQYFSHRGTLAPFSVLMMIIGAVSFSHSSVVPFNHSTSHIRYETRTQTEADIQLQQEALNVFSINEPDITTLDD